MCVTVASNRIQGRNLGVPVFNKLLCSVIEDDVCVAVTRWLAQRQQRGDPDDGSVPAYVFDWLVEKQHLALSDYIVIAHVRQGATVRQLTLGSAIGTWTSPARRPVAARLSAPCCWRWRDRRAQDHRGHCVTVSCR